MPRYFFHVRSESVIEDCVGVVLGDDAEAQREAQRDRQVLDDQLIHGASIQWPPHALFLAIASLQLRRGEARTS